MWSINGHRANSLRAQSRGETRRVHVLLLDTILALRVSIQTDVPYTGRICNESRFDSRPIEAVPMQLVLKLLTLFV